MTHLHRDEHGSISAVARALGVSRNRAIAEGQRLGLRDLSPKIPDDVAEQYRQERSLAKLAEHYGTSAPTVSRWLTALGIP